MELGPVGGIPGSPPPRGGLDEQFRCLLEYATRAPSTRNTQPWRFSRLGDRIRIYADSSRKLQIADSNGREMVMSVGAALYHLELAMRCFLLGPQVLVLPDSSDPDFIAEVIATHKGHPTREDWRLLEEVGRRATQRAPFDADAPEEAFHVELMTLAKAEGAAMTFRSNNTDPELVQMIVDSEMRLADAPAFKEEAQKWPISPSDLWRKAPSIALLTMPNDRRSDWVFAGRALARALLCASSWGVSCAFLNHPLHWPEVRADLPRLFGANGVAQLLLGFGYGIRSQPSVRRPINALLRDEGSAPEVRV